MASFFSRARDPISSFTHLLGAVLSAFVMLSFIIKFIALDQKNPVPLIAALLFGVSLLALYTASAVYHFYNGSADTQRRLRKLDHSMIYVLIAGTYTPVSAAFMSPRDAVIFLSVIWTIAVSGIIIKLCWLNAPRFLSTTVYLLMGWAIVFDIRAFKTVPAPCLLFIALGGAAYTVGAVFYMLKKPNINARWSFHELFHLLILLGSALHFVAVFCYAL